MDKIENAKIDTPRTEETSETRAEQYHKEALQLAQNLSQRWQQLRDALKADPHLPISSKLREIEDMTRPPVSGIQAWFESSVKFINTKAEGQPGARSTMMYRLKEDLRRIENSLDSVLE